MSRQLRQPFNSLAEIVPALKNGRETIGKGSFGNVKLIKHKSDKESLYAMKTMEMRSSLEKKFILEEIRLHRSLDHENIVKLHDSIIGGKKAYIFLEYAERGDLFHLITRSLSTDIPKMLKIFCQCVRAVRYIHRRNIMHRDLKPENILLDSEFNAKLCDFGWSAEFNENVTRESICGTAEYMAPEVFHKKKQTKMTDVWSLGTSLSIALY